jgi:hypothetical protein
MIVQRVEPEVSSVIPAAIDTGVTSGGRARKASNSRMSLPGEGPRTTCTSPTTAATRTGPYITDAVTQ